MGSPIGSPVIGVQMSQPIGMIPAAGGPSGDGWTCPQCGNNNFAHRAVCNMRKCGAPRPQPGMGNMLMQAAPAQRPPMMQMPARDDAQGGWTCLKCGNKNYANRDVCNMRKCGAPRPGGVGGGMHGGQVTVDTGVAQQALQLLQASGLCQIPGVQQAIGQIATQNMQVMSQALPMQTGRVKPPQQEFKEGSWVCLACKNVNFPNRESCNGRSCGKPREEVDGGPPPRPEPRRLITKPGQSGPYPEGSWVCSECRNVNYPTRVDACGKRTCGRPRSEVDIGPPEENGM